jgi:hypothetical protein
MTDQPPYPPPGAPPPPGYQPQEPQGPSRWMAPQQPSPPGYPPHPGQAPTQPQWRPAPGMLGAAHKPGAMPLRPLGLGDIYDAAFRIIRFNPKATVGSAVLVAVVVMAIPVGLTAVLTWTVGTALDETGNLDSSDSEAYGALGSMVSLGLGAVLLQVGLIFVTGMIAHVANAAAIGRRLSLAEAWAATRGKRWRLLGLTLVINLMALAMLAAYVVVWVVLAASVTDALPLVLFGLVSVPLFVVGMAFFWIRVYYLPAPVLMLEDVGVFGAIGRGYRLTSRQFWRTFGIALLTIVIGSFAGSMLAFPVSLAGQIFTMASPEYATLGLVLTQAVSTVISAAFVVPFSAAVASLQYLDQRMRKEAFDVELMTRAGITSR